MVLVDQGYSNWTIEGTDAHCLLKKNPEYPRDYWYGHDPSVKHAEKCDVFKAGEPVEIDVERADGSYLGYGKWSMEDYSQDPEIRQLLKSFEE